MYKLLLLLSLLFLRRSGGCYEVDLFKADHSTRQASSVNGTTQHVTTMATTNTKEVSQSLLKQCDLTITYLTDMTPHIYNGRVVTDWLE